MGYILVALAALAVGVFIAVVLMAGAEGEVERKIKKVDRLA
jgi:hypothetical protein